MNMPTRAHMRRVAALLYDHNFLVKAEAATNREELVKLFNDHHVHVNNQDLTALAAFIKREHGEELSEAEHHILAGRNLEIYSDVPVKESREVFAVFSFE